MNSRLRNVFIGFICGAFVNIICVMFGFVLRDPMSIIIDIAIISVLCMLLLARK